MVASIFQGLIAKFLPSLAKKITQTVNDKSEEIQYEHKKYLKKDFSIEMKWQSLSTNTNVVAADVVSLDSKLSPKKRGSIRSAEGEVPKLGMIKSLNESSLQGLKNLKARGKKEKELVKKLFQDAADGIKGIYERLDIMFLQALSTGVTVIDEENNTGTGVRIDFGVPKGNQFGVKAEWNKPTASPISDIDNILTNARNAGHVLKYIWFDKVTFNSFKANDQLKKAYAGFLKTDSSFVFRISQEELHNFMYEEFGLKIIIIDKLVQIEKGGKRVAVDPWQRGNVTFTTSTDLGTLTYGELAEVDHPVKDVEYSTVDDFVLVSLFRTNNPLKENTSVQALAIPVLDNVDSIFIMDTNEAEALHNDDNENEGGSGTDDNITIWGNSYAKATVISIYNEIEDENLSADINDADLIGKINQLSDEGVDLLKGELNKP